MMTLCRLRPLSSVTVVVPEMRRVLRASAHVRDETTCAARAACSAACASAPAVAVSSVSATEGWAGGTAYCASKGALSAACRALDRELAAKKIRVRAIEPNHVLTDMFRKGAGRMGVPESAARSPESLAQEVREMIDNRW